MTTKTPEALVVLDRLIGNARTMAGLSGDPRMRENLRDGEKVRCAFAELIAADKEWDASFYDFNSCHMSAPNMMAKTDRMTLANARRQEALAAVEVL